MKNIRLKNLLQMILKKWSMEAALYTWFLNERGRPNIVTNEILREKAKEFYQSLNNVPGFRKL